MQTDNCAILMPDVLADVAWLFDSRPSATPAEFHALNSLVEAVIFHETLYLYDLPTNYTPSKLYSHLVEEEIIHPVHSPKIFETELKSRGMEDLALDVLTDRVYGSANIGYAADSGAATLSSLVEYEKHLGFARMSRIRVQSKEMALFFAKVLEFTPEDAIAVDDTYRRVRAFAACASELNLAMYTGIVSRPFVLGFLSDRRRGCWDLYEKMREELDDVEDTDLPSWRRIEIPPLTQILLRNCRDSPDALANELTQLRHRLRKFRKTLTEQVEALKSAKSRGEKRKVRRETEKAWAALLEKQDRSTRLSHQLWELFRIPIMAPIVAIDKAVGRDKLNQAILKRQGLTDLWRVLYDAPTIEENVTLVKKVFRIDVEPSDWSQVARVVAELESVMTRNDEPSLPSTN